MKFLLYLCIVALFLILAIKTHGIKRVAFIVFLSYIVGLGIYTFVVI